MTLHATNRVFPLPDTSATQGRIRWAPQKSIWTFAHMGLGLGGIIALPHWDAALVFVVLTGVTICAGHSVGMHRLLIHRSFTTPRWLEYLLVWLGTLVGMAGPIGMIFAHDMRDWHQRQTVCPPHPSHGAGFWRDMWWQMHCTFDLDHPPHFQPEDHITHDRIYSFMEKHWMAQQLPLAVVLFACGGLPWVLWGISLRIWVSLTGHWLIGHYAHRTGHQGWRIAGLPVQGYNLRGLGLITFGENWHSNHHAFPHSAKMGVEAGQLDPGYLLIRMLAAIGLARDIQLPHSAPARQGLTRTRPPRPKFPIAKTKSRPFSPIS